MLFNNEWLPWQYASTDDDRQHSVSVYECHVTMSDYHGNTHASTDDTRQHSVRPYESYVTMTTSYGSMHACTDDDTIKTVGKLYAHNNFSHTHDVYSSCHIHDIHSSCHIHDV